MTKETPPANQAEAEEANKGKQDAFRKKALEYHRLPEPGKIAIAPTKSMATQTDLALAYSPGVAAPCEEIEQDPQKAYDYTSKGNTVAVITNGTAVLGLGNIGALASKPVMEGKSVLFKKFANIDSVDIEVNETDIDRFVDIVASLEPTYGGINLEDIKAPECFEIERRLKERMNIPVFHDDQHGTAIIVGAAMKNWIELTGRDLGKQRLVCSGAGASAIACLSLLVEAGLKKENIIVCDSRGVIYKGRNEGMSPVKEQFAADTDARTIEDAIKGADIFLGLSKPGSVTKDMIGSMGKAPLVMALANPTPEIMPEEAKAAKPDCVVCTGRSDFPNQVNNVLCFPFIFRGALDVGATTINEEMKLACVEAIAALARKIAPAEVTNVYSNEDLTFGPEYLIPKPFDPRLIVDLPKAVAKAAMDSGVATRPITDFDAYHQRLTQYYVRSQLIMHPICVRCKEAPKRVVYCEGEEERVLHAVQAVLDDGLAVPILIGRKRVIDVKIRRLGLRMKPGKDFQLVVPENDARYDDYWQTYHKVMERRGITPAIAKTVLRGNNTVIGALMVHQNEADAVICGTFGQYRIHAKHLIDILGLKPGVETAAALNVLILPRGTYFFCDTQVNPDPSIAQISEMTLLAAEEVRRFGITPKVALMSHSNFGSSDFPSALKMRHAYEDIKRRDPTLQVEGEIHADSALDPNVRDKVMPNSPFEGEANLFVMPNVDAANIAFNMMKVMGDGVNIGPILLGAERPVYVLTPSVASRGIINATALATVTAQVYEESQQTIDF